MALLADMAGLRERVASSPGRLEKRRLVAEYLRSLSADDLTRAVAYLSGRAFPVSDSRVLNVRGLPPAAPRDPSAPPLTLEEVAQTFGEVAAAAGAGSRRRREALLTDLSARASDAERDLLQRIIFGELRMGLSEGLVLEEGRVMSVIGRGAQMDERRVSSVGHRASAAG